MRNKPRRAGKRWTFDAPAYVLDCFDDPRTADRYTVLFGGEHLTHDGRYWTVQYLAMSEAPSHPQGVSMWGEMNQTQAAGWRYVNGKRRVAWRDLPTNIREHVAARLAHAERMAREEVTT